MVVAKVLFKNSISDMIELVTNTRIKIVIGGHFEILSKLLVDIVGFCGGFFPVI